MREVPANPNEGVETETSLHLVQARREEAIDITFSRPILIVPCRRLLNGFVELSSTLAKFFAAAKKSSKNAVSSAKKPCFMFQKFATKLKTRKLERFQGRLKEGPFTDGCLFRVTIFMLRKLYEKILNKIMTKVIFRKLKIGNVSDCTDLSPQNWLRLFISSCEQTSDTS